MTKTRLDVLAIGDAVVDVIATADDAFLATEGLVRGSMRSLDADAAARLYAHMGPAREVSGGSVANSIAGIARMGGRAGFVGQVAVDQLGDVFTHDIRSLGVEFVTAPLSSGAPTGRCLILVTPDGQRTMSTYQGAAHQLSVEALDAEQIRAASILYLEAYLWWKEGPRDAMKAAAAIAREAGRKVALTLSDIACIARHRDDFLNLIADGGVDMLFANEDEIMAMAGCDDVDAAITAFAPQVPLLIVTRGSKGAVGVEQGRFVQVPAVSIEKVVDTTGAGDLFAAGVLMGQSTGRSLEDSLRIGAQAAAEVISHFGARPEIDLRGLLV